MATKTLKSMKGRVMRITRLDECGTPIIGACSSIVTAGFISVGWTPNVEAGEEYTQKNAWGDFCISEKDYDRTKWVDVAVSLCDANPDVVDMIAGGDIITDGTDTIGMSFGSDGNLQAFGLEVWTKQAGGACLAGTPQWGYFVSPFVKNGNLDGGPMIENGTMSLGLKGEAQPATTAWATNPYPDNPLLAAAGFPVGKMWAYVLTTTQPPAATASCVALA